MTSKDLSPKEQAETRRPEPKYKKGQIVVMKNPKKVLPFMIRDVLWDGAWFYAWSSKSYAAESMIRELTPEEKGI